MEHTHQTDPYAYIEIGDYYLIGGQAHLCHNKRIKTIVNQSTECSKIISSSDKKLNL